MAGFEKKIRLFILRKLVKKRMWGGKHTHIDNLPKGLAKHDRKIAKNIIKDLIKANYIITKPTHQGIHISLNPKFMKEIMKEI